MRRPPSFSPRFTLLLALLISSSFPGCVESRKTLHARVWPTVGQTEFSTVHGNPEWEGRRRPTRTVGLAFTGGGTISATATVGALRGLQHLGLLDEVDYVSGVSGGTWGVLPWVFLDLEAARSKGEGLGTLNTQTELDELYLGTYKAPGLLTKEDFISARKGSLVRMVTETKLALPLMDMRGDENYANQLSKTFLRPLGLGEQSRYVARDEDHAESLVKRNASAGLRREKLHVAGKNKPFLIANMALERPDNSMIGYKLVNLLLPFVPTPLSDGYFHAEATPLYSGMRTLSTPGLLPQLTAGGGYVETLGFDARFKSWSSPGREARVAHFPSAPWFRRDEAFSLADMLAASGSAPAAAWGTLADGLGFRPEFWSFNPSSKKPPTTNLERPFVDGGACDNTGVAALIAHGATDIVAFLNAVPAFDYQTDGDPDHLPTMITALFGKEGKDGWRNSLKNHENNHLLHNPGNQKLKRLAQAFYDLAKAGKPLVFCDDYLTASNTKGLQRYGVKPNQPVRICWVYLTSIKLHPSTSPEAHNAVMTHGHWLSELTGEARDLFTHQSLRKNSLSNFPVFSVFFTNPAKVQDLETIQANALAHYSSHNVVMGAAQIRRCFR